MTRRLYVSDVHLEPEDKDRLRAFSNLLHAANNAVDEIYVLGDLCEMWIGDDDDSPLVQALAELFCDLSSGVQLHFLAGNRDFLLGQEFASRTGLRLLNDPHRLVDGTLLTHGDTLCTDDHDYQQMRILLHSAEWQAEILAKSLAQRRDFGAGLRAQSKAANANKAGNIMDVNLTAVASLAREAGSQVLIHGHTHRPGVHPLSTSAQGIQSDACDDSDDGIRLVLGAWERCGWWAIQEDQALRLRCAPVAWLGNQTPESINAQAAFLP